MWTRVSLVAAAILASTFFAAPSALANEKVCQGLDTSKFAVVGSADGDDGVHVQARLLGSSNCVQAFASSSGIQNSLHVWISRSTDGGKTWETLGESNTGPGHRNLYKKSPGFFQGPGDRIKACAANIGIFAKPHSSSGGNPGDLTDDGVDVKTGKPVCTKFTLST
jgi:hypothetical protein